MAEFIFPFTVALILTALLVPISIRFAKKFNLMDDPSTHKHPAILHKKPIPRAGGLPIFIGILIAILIFIPIDSIIIAIIIAGLLVTLTGILDDRFDLSPYVRFLLNIVAAIIVVSQGVTIPFIKNPLGGFLYFDLLSISIFGFDVPQILAVVWIVWIMNMLNWSKGVDGQMPGIAVISAIVIGIASLRFTPLGDLNLITSQMSFIVAGAALGFLIFNFYPAKIFPGYSGTILGFMIGVLSIISGVKLATAVLVMGVPTADAIFIIIRRIVSKKSPFFHDKGHLHHLLLNLGMGHRSVAAFYWVMSAVLGMIALSVSSRGKFFAIILVLVVVGGFILMIRFGSRGSKDYD